MKNIKDLLYNGLISGLIGIGIGTIWMAMDFLFSLNGQNPATAKIYLTTFLFWTIISFLIGIFFYLASWIFNSEKWSLKKQIFINFFVCFIAWFLLILLIDNFSISLKMVIRVTVDFIIMYAIAYGGYFLHLRNTVRRINAKLKEK